MIDLLAHAAPVTYRFPLPIWLYVAAGGAAVLLSAPAAALAVRADPGRGWRSRDLYPALRRLRLGAIGLAAASALLAVAVVGGLGASSVEGRIFFENPATLLIWVDFWVGLGVVSMLAGNVWDFVSPLNAAARAVDRALARRDVAPLRYPDRLGQWPAVALLLVWTWMELIWDAAKEPRTIAALALAYVVVSVAGAALVGAETWLANVEVFTVVARTFARCAPTELTPRNPDEWLAEEPTGRELRLRPYFTGLRTDPALPAGGSALVLTMLATVVYDGFSQTNRFAELQGWFLDRSTWLGLHVDLLDTLLMVAIVALFVAAFLIVSSVGGGLEAARRFAPTLIPIAAVYFVAHYLAYLLLAGQRTPTVLVDPLGLGWNPVGLGHYEIWTGIAPAALVWWSQVLLIVVGHVAAVVAAQRVELAVGRGRSRSLAAQAPLVALMVGYTVAGLWVLAQQIRAVE